MNPRILARTLAAAALAAILAGTPSPAAGSGSGEAGSGSGEAGSGSGEAGGPAGAAPSSARDGQADPRDTPHPREQEAPDPTFKEGFHFGTYGRVQFSSDLAGATGQTTNIVTHGARLMEGSYAELDFGYRIRAGDMKVRVLATIALFDEFFHFTGVGIQAIGLRNLYAEATGFLPTNLGLWVGSRMYRGDDIYLLDWWPLDSLNTLGGGLWWEGSGVKLQAHVGVNRLKDKNTFQRISVPSTFGADEITLMERQRVIGSAKGTYHAVKIAGDLSLKVSVYGEFHYLPKGTLRYSEDYADYFEEFAIEKDPALEADLPADTGGVIGAQLGLWGFGPDSHVNLFARYAWGLAAYGEWGVPWGISLERTSAGAKEFVLAGSFNWEGRDFGLMGGTYGRLFVDADGNRYDLDDYWEGITTLRPAWFVTRHYHQLFELSHQWKVPRGVGPNDTRHHVPQVVQMSVIPALTLDRGNYRRPQFRLVYTASWLNQDARNLFPRFDQRRDKAWQHYIGVQVEWWLDSSSYP